ncbi:splicing factor ESS-2 homolog [Hydra vulgaris]|uniref:Splicing factor ESS-2 homolog n=1 Tax=Hydra vulgaris TaxID=6087 RepID=A0ABM4CNF9_HYDVU
MANEVVASKDKNMLAVSGPVYTTNTKIKQKILDEEEYLTILEKIVERDFYPELTKLKLRLHYLNALETDDVEKLREIQLQLERETPCAERKETPRTFDIKLKEEDSLSNIDKDKNQKLSLDSFLLKNTSEDNASFEKIMEITRKKHREKYAWLFEKQEEQEAREILALTLPKSNEEQLKALENLSSNVETWKYVPRNALMYTPDGVDLSLEEFIKKKGEAQQVIRHENTRFKSDPFDSAASHASLVRATQDLSSLRKKTGKVGVDGHLEHQNVTPTVQGYGFVATPSPAPGVDASPLMTWGEIEGTPLRLDATPLSNNVPSFKIPEPPRREMLAHSLAEKASKQHREKRKKAFAAATASLFSPKNSPRQGMLTSERLEKLSPAAQKLLKAGVRVGTDKSLQASYSPSPIAFNIYGMSPKNRTPGSQRQRTKTPGSTHDDSSITDDLLKLPEV